MLEGEFIDSGVFAQVEIWENGKINIFICCQD